jgi:hypothetical protein
VRLERVLEEPLHVVLRSAQLAASAPHVSLDRLSGKPLVLSPRIQAPAIYHALIVQVRRGGATPMIAQEAMETQTIRCAARRGDWPIARDALDAIAGSTRRGLGPTAHEARCRRPEPCGAGARKLCSDRTRA